MAYGVSVSTPIIRPHHPFQNRDEKKAPCPQSCWITKRRMTKAALVSDMPTESHGLIARDHHDRAKMKAKGSAVTTNSKRLRDGIGVR